MTEAEKLTASATREMQSAWLKVGAVYGTVAAAGGMLMKQIAGTAMRTQELGIVLGVVSRNAGVTAETTDRLEAEMKDLGMTTQAARTIITRMIQTNVDLSKATNLVRVAQDMAVISMEDSSTAAQGLMRAIVTMNPILLRKYGIMTGLEDIDRRAGEALGILTYETEKSGKVVKKWTRDITAAERQQAIFNMILEEGGKFAGTYAGAMEAPGKAMRSFSRYIMEAQEAIGQYWLPVMNAAVGVATKFIKAFIDAPEIVHQLASALLVATTVVAGITAAIIAKTLALGPLSAAFATASTAASTFGLSLGVATAGLTLIVAALVLLYQHQQKVNATFTEAESKVLATAGSYEKYRKAVFDAALETGKISGRYIHTEQAMEAMTNRLALSREEFDLYKWAVKESEGAVFSFADAQMYLVQHLAAADAAVQASAEAQRALRDEMLYGEELFRRLGIEVGAYADRLEEAMARAAGAMTVWEYKVKDSESYWNTLVASTEKGAIMMRTAFHDLGEEVAFWGEAMESTFVETLSAATTMWEKMQEILQSALQEMGSAVSNYNDKVAEAWDSFHARVEGSALQHQMSMQKAEIQYQRSREELIAKANAEIAAMEAAGLDEEAADRQKKLDEELGMLEYNYEKQKAWAKWHWEIQQAMQEQAHHLRLAEMAEFAIKESQIIIEQARAKLEALTAELAQTAIWAKSKLSLMAAVAQGSADAARAEILTLQTVIDARKAMVKNWEADLGKHLAKVDAITAEIQALIERGPNLPEVPDFSQWVKDFTGTASKAAAKTKEAVTKTLKEMMVDIATGFSAAMDIFRKVARYVTPTGLAEGMDILRKDIEMAVEQLYQAYKEVGKKGVKGAKLFAESVGVVMSMIGGAVEAFGLLKGYSQTMTSDIDKFINDLEYILVAIRTRLLDLWSWKGARTDTVWGHMESWANTVGGVVDMIGNAVATFTAIRRYKGLMPEALDMLLGDIEAMLYKLGQTAPRFEDEALYATSQFAEIAGQIIEAIGRAIDTLVALRDYASPSREAIDNFFADLEYFLDTFAWGMWRFENLATEKAAETAGLMEQILDSLGKAIQPLIDLAEYAPNQADFRHGVELFFANLEYFLDEFAMGMWRFENLASIEATETARLLEEIVGGLGAAIQPLLDLAEYTVTPAEFQRAADLFFDHLLLFIEMFAARADEFDAHMTDEVAGLAEAIGRAVGGIGAAIQSLINLAEYGYATDEKGNKVWWDPEELVQSYEHFFYHLGMILFLLEQEAARWEVSGAAKKLAAAVAQVTSDLGTAVGFLADVADYGVDKSAFALLGFQHFLNDLKAIIFMIEEASVEMSGAVEAARAFADVCVEVLSNLQRGIDKLNELTGLGTPPEDLVEAGKKLIQSLMDGMEEKGQEAIAALIGILDNTVDVIISWANIAGVPTMYYVGQSLIQGIINGLWSQASTLYNTIWQIMQNAIAAAEMAAGVASFSKLTFNLGAELTEGFIRGMQANQQGVINSLAGMLAMPMTFAPQLAGAGGGETHTHYHYQEAEGIGADARASLRQQYEAMELYERLRS